MSEKSDLYKKGQEVRRELFGEEAFTRVNSEVYGNPVMDQFRDVATEIAFGAVWSRPGLDHKTRALICVISDVSTGRDPELEIHLNFALRQGWTQQELIEAILHLSPYVGLPFTREAMLVAKKVFDEWNAKK